MGPRILGPAEPEASQVITDVFEREGIRVLTGAQVTRVSHEHDTFRIETDGPTVEADRLLVAAGRRLHLHGLGLESVGLDPYVRAVATDDRQRAGERLWAVGDITGKGQFTHVSMYQGEVVAVDDVLERDGRRADYRALSWVTFTDPEVAAVGMTEQQARDAGLRVRVGRADIPESSRGWIHQAGNDGIVKVVEDADRGVLVGATVVSPAGGEVIGLLAILLSVHAEVPVTTLRGMHFAYPTFHRTIESALDDLAAGSIGSVRHMRAVVYWETGPSSVLSVVERELREPGPGEVRVRVVRAAVNPTDWKSRAGAIRSGPFDEVAPDQDGAGVVDALGEGVEGFAVGDRVWLMLAAHQRPTGTAQELTVLPAERVVPLPEGAASTSAPTSVCRP